MDIVVKLNDYTNGGEQGVQKFFKNI